LAYPFSLKEKRRLLKSLIAQIKRDYNVSIAEIDHLDDRRSAVLGVALVSNDGRLNQRVLDKLAAWIDRHPEITVEHCETEIV
jgi:hypothetical protein